MKLRNFLATLFCLPLFGCIHWPGIDNKKHKPLNEENAGESKGYIDLASSKDFPIQAVLWVDKDGYFIQEIDR